MRVLVTITILLVLLIAAHAKYHDEELYKGFYRYKAKYYKLLQIDPGTFNMGSRNKDFKETGEFPLRKVFVDEFVIDQFPVTNAMYAYFMEKTSQKIKTRAQKYGYSNVYFNALDKDAQIKKDAPKIPGEPWWFPVKGAKWNRPEGGNSNLTGRWHYPVVHVSQKDADSYCDWMTQRLPTEEEWERAARAEINNAPYPWGDMFKHNRTNLWQGIFPLENKVTDGYEFLAPVDAYPAQNRNDLYDMIGNAWEWTSTRYHRPYQNRSHGVVDGYDGNVFALKGGSFIDFREDKAHINHAVRNSVRMGRPQQFTAQNIGFRCAGTRLIRPSKLRKVPQKLHGRDPYEAMIRFEKVKDEL